MPFYVDFLVVNIDLVAILPSFISFVCPVIWGGEEGVAKKRYPAYKRDWLVILMLNNFNKKQRATTLLLFLAGNNLRFVN
ncbi:hypothetical protein [Klebsiella pneumoniae]|uniref:hypothetical protein n=1 Tax=Klebsiella pneumoniae TaxID=573 RepID=UPI00388EBCCD